jgi:hypothetical protein
MMPWHFPAPAGFNVPRYSGKPPQFRRAVQHLRQGQEHQTGYANVDARIPAPPKPESITD